MASPPPLPVTNPQTGVPEIYVAQPKGKSEPVVIATSVTAILVQIIGAAAAFGLSLTDAQRTAILSCVEPIVLALFVLGPIIRQYVVPAWKAKALVDAAHIAGAAGLDKPTV